MLRQQPAATECVDFVPLVSHRRQRKELHVRLIGRHEFLGLRPASFSPANGISRIDRV